MGQPVVHFDIGCRDNQKSNDFYTSLFGWKTAENGPFSREVDTDSDQGIQGAITSLGHEPHNYVMIYVEVEDIPATLESVEELGGKIVIPETPVPGKGFFAWFSDLDGNMMGLWKNTPPSNDS